MKVVILSGYGGSVLPEEFKVDYSNPLWRFDKGLIRQIESKDWFSLSDEDDSSGIGFYCQEISDGMEYLYPTPDDSTSFSIFCIIDVDIKRPWCIEEYDGSEYIKYLDDYKCISKELNFYQC